MRCPNCGFEGEVKFCPQCGTPMEEMSLVSSNNPILSAEKKQEHEVPISDSGVSQTQDDQMDGEKAYYRSKPIKKQGIGSKFGAFWRKNKRNKALVIIAAIILIGIIRSIIGGIGSPDIETSESFDWPNNDMAQMIPEPEGKLTYVSTVDGEYLGATVECNTDQYNTFVDGCKKMGFDKNKDFDQYEDVYSYSAENKDTFTLSANYYDGELSIQLNSPKEETNETEKTTEATTEKKEEKSKDDVSADFKETMDEYEEFMNDYVDFMKKYENSDDSASMLVDYGKMMTKYSDFTKKIDDIDEDKLSDADYAYYMEVTGRVTEKLAELY